MPVTVNTYEPAGVVELVVTVSADDAPVAGFGLKVPAAPPGSPLIDSVTGPVKPPVFVMLVV